MANPSDIENPCLQCSVSALTVHVLFTHRQTGFADVPVSCLSRLWDYHPSGGFFFRDSLRGSESPNTISGVEGAHKHYI